MLIKYRVHEVAKDLNVPSKEVISLLKKHFGDTKKHMTALTEEELDVVFDFYTQQNAIENFDSYFAVRDQAIEKHNEEKEQKSSGSRQKKGQRKNKGA